MAHTPANLRRVGVKAITEAGWVAGTLHVPTSVRLADFLERAPNFLSVSDVQMPSRSNERPFFALRRSSIEFLVVDGEEDPTSANHTQIMEDHSVLCLLPNARLRGTIAVQPGFRLSDYLARDTPFIPVTGCTYQVRATDVNAAAKESAAFVLLNSEKVIGVSERDDPSRK